MPEHARTAIMWRLLEEGAALFSACWQAPTERVAVENPVVHRHAREGKVQRDTQEADAVLTVRERSTLPRCKAKVAHRKVSAMADPTLCGNNDPCDACALRREMQDTTKFTRPTVPCNVCGGRGFLPLSEAEIVRRTVDEARRIYWPEFNRRTQ